MHKQAVNISYFFSTGANFDETIVSMIEGKTVNELPKRKLVSYSENVVVRVEADLAEQIKYLKVRHQLNMPEILRQALRESVREVMKKIEDEANAA